MHFHHHTRVWALDGCTEAIAATLVLLLLIDDILVIIGVPEAVFIPMVVFMDVTLIRVHLSEPLPWRLGSVSKEGPEVVMLLGNILGRGDKISFALPPLVSTKLCQPSPHCSVGRTITYLFSTKKSRTCLAVSLCRFILLLQTKSCTVICMAFVLGILVSRCPAFPPLLTLFLPDTYTFLLCKYPPMILL
jgi:hypothetical protein